MFQFGSVCFGNFDWKFVGVWIGWYDFDLFQIELFYQFMSQFYVGGNWMVEMDFDQFFCYGQ